jgi:hypothetical protein
MNLSDRMVGGVSAGGRLSFAGVNLTVAYEYDRLRSADGTGTPSKDAFFLSTGLSASF